MVKIIAMKNQSFQEKTAIYVCDSILDMSNIESPRFGDIALVIQDSKRFLRGSSEWVEQLCSSSGGAVTTFGDVKGDGTPENPIDLTSDFKATIAEKLSAVVSDGTTITGSGTESDPLVAHGLSMQDVLDEMSGNYFPLSGGNVGPVIAESLYTESHKTKRIVPAPDWFTQWRLDETSGYTITDSRNGNNGDSYSDLSGRTVPGVLGTAISFDGSESSNIVVYGIDDPFNLDATDFTISFWLKKTGYGWMCPICKHEDNGNYANGWEVRIWDDGRLAFISGEEAFVALLYPPQDQWCFVCITFSKTTGNCTIRLDNQQETWTGMSRIGFSWFSPVSIGFRPGPEIPMYLSGVLDEIRIYKTELVKEQIDWLYANRDSSLDVPSMEFEVDGVSGIFASSTGNLVISNGVVVGIN